MRLKRLDLTRYGKFTDRKLDFGVLEPGRPDLHVVYGPNEAGKSTALAAFLDLLFGVEARTRYNFPASERGHARSAGHWKSVAPSISWRGSSEAPTPCWMETGVRSQRRCLKGQLGGIDRESYRAMFSLDDDTLEAGGESILASKGDLGQLLFSASAGLADLSRRVGRFTCARSG